VQDKKKTAAKDSKGGDVLNRGMSLAKSYSQMTEAERKELIKKAFEAKQQLQQELEVTKKKVAKKDEELRKLQEKVHKIMKVGPKERPL
jgi:flagellar motility protein MotE (MotC chaperone)